MSKKESFQILRRIITSRNLLIGIALLILIAPCFGDANTSTITSYYDTSGAYSPTNVDWATVHDYSGSVSNIGGTVRADVYCGSTTNKYGRIYRSIHEFNTSSLPDDAVIESVIFSIKPEALSNSMIDSPYYSICSFTPPGAYGTWETDFWYYENFGDSLGSIAYSTLSLGTYYNITLDESVSINLTGISCFGGRIKFDNDNSAPTWGNGDFVGINLYDGSSKLYISYWSESEGNPDPDAYNIDLSASGTFCYGHAISFNLSETTTQEYGMYDISCYLNGDAVSKYSETEFQDGPLLWTKTLEPGDWAVMGWWVGPGDAELTTWLNFTIDSTCNASTFSGTINESYIPGELIVYDWEWNAYDYLNSLEPWEVPTFDNGNGTSLIDYMYSEGFINESEYNTLYNIVVIQAAANSNLTNTTMQYTYGVLTPFIMINDSISTIRADVNSSYSVLNDAISPITTIFTWIFQMIPIAIIDLMSVILVFDAVRVILAGRKN